MKPMFFDRPAKFREWLKKNHRKADELWVGFYKKASGRPSITYAEAVDEALCFGWIDGIRKNVDEVSYTNRFTPRRPKSNWSAINLKRVAELIAAGRMAPAGLDAFNARDPNKANQYSYENAPRQLDVAAEKQFKANKKAWTFFQAQPPGYRKLCAFWINSAKKEETRQKRLAFLIECSEREMRLPPLQRPEKK